MEMKPTCLQDIVELSHCSITSSHSGEGSLLSYVIDAIHTTYALRTVRFSPCSLFHLAYKRSALLWHHYCSRDPRAVKAYTQMPGYAAFLQ
jgi:hypothetical protein